jgi:hypothetical protein
MTPWLTPCCGLAVVLVVLVVLVVVVAAEPAPPEPGVGVDAPELAFPAEAGFPPDGAAPLLVAWTAGVLPLLDGAGVKDVPPLLGAAAPEPLLGAEV